MRPRISTRPDRRRPRGRHQSDRRRRQRRHHADRRGRPDRRARRGLPSARRLAARRRRLRAAGRRDATGHGGAVRGRRARRLGHRSTPTSGSACRRAAAWCWCATGLRSRRRFGHEEAYMRRDDDGPERGRAHARVLAAVPLAQALARLPRARRRRVPRLDRATRSCSPGELAEMVRATRARAAVPSRRSRPSASVTLPQGGDADLDAHNPRWPGDPERLARLPRVGRGRRTHLPAAVLRQLPHPPARTRADQNDRRDPGRIRCPGPRSTGHPIAGGGDQPRAWSGLLASSSVIVLPAPSRWISSSI